MRHLTKLPMVIVGLSLMLGCQSTSPDSPQQETGSPLGTIQPLAEQQTSLQFELEFTTENSGNIENALEILFRIPSTEWVSLGIYGESPVTFIAEGAGLHEFIGLAFDGQGNRQPMPAEAQATTTVPDPIIITDRHGEDFDITNAVLRYQLHEQWWGHGIGRHAIQPINDPRFLEEGDAGYPDQNNTTSIMGVAIDDQFHAYAIHDLLDKEVVNDRIGDAYFSATY